MKDFSNWGVRVRKDLNKNYYSVWANLVTTRLDLGPESPLGPELSEFYDVGITEKCNAMCDFCYVEAGSEKKDYTDICKTWNRFIDTLEPDEKIYPGVGHLILDEIMSMKDLSSLPEEVRRFKVKTRLLADKYNAYLTKKPFQIAIGSTGEPTIHPDFSKFLQRVYETRVVPNYTTNGIILSGSTKKSDEILEATKNFCGGVAVSFGNISLREKAKKAIERLAKDGECKIMIHELIGNKSDVDDFLELDKEYKDKIHYHVLLPLMKHGRSQAGMDTETYRYLIEKINKEGMENLAFGANFLPFFEENQDLQPKVWEYPRHHYSHNMLLKNGDIVITPSSYDLEPCKIL